MQDGVGFQVQDDEPKFDALLPRPRSLEKTRWDLLFKVVIDVNMALAEMANILVMSMNLMQSLGAKDTINQDAKVL